MIIFTIKLLSNLRKAIAGRKHPYQLAWAVAFGALLGIVPHGNLLALAILIVVLSLKVNHAMAALVTIGVTFASTRLDPVSHQTGAYVLSHDTTGPMLSNLWKLPLVPWTDVNNTVVLGSFLIGVAALVPIFMLTYPIFRLFAPEDDESIGGDEGLAHSAESQSDSQEETQADGRYVFVDDGHAPVVNPRTPHSPRPTQPQHTSNSSETTPHGQKAGEPSAAHVHVHSAHGQPVSAIPTTSVETRIDVIRAKETPKVDSRVADTTGAKEQSTNHSDTTTTEQQQRMDEALSYLLHQLRDSQQKDAA